MKSWRNPGSTNGNGENFIEATRQFVRREHPTAPLLRELIDKSEVLETEGTGRNRTRRIIIHYRLVGYIELSDTAFRSCRKANTRGDVAVEYLTEPQTA